MSFGVRREQALSSLLTILILAVLAAPASALGPVHPPATTLDVGTVGVDDRFAHAAAEGGLLVAPGSEITLRAPYAFEDAQGPAAGVSYSFAANLRVHAETGQIAVVVATNTTSSPGAFAAAGVLEVTFRVPEVVRGLTVTLDAAMWLGGQPGGLVTNAHSSAPLTLVAVPEPVAFLTEDLVVGDSLDGGTMTVANGSLSAVATNGHTFVSTDLGTRVTTAVSAERPEFEEVSMINFWVSATLSVQAEGGPSYSVSRQFFADQCSDWSTHACRLEGETRDEALALVVPPTAIGPRTVVKVDLHVSIESSWYHAPSGDGEWVFEMGGDQGRHLVVGV